MQLKDELTEKMGLDIDETDVISASLYPKVCEDFINFRNTYGPVELLSTRIFLEGPKVGDEFEVSTCVVGARTRNDRISLFRLNWKKERHCTSKLSQSLRPGSLANEKFSSN